MHQRKPRILAVLMAIVLVLPIYSSSANGAEVQTYQNPSQEEIARKIEIVGRSKGIPSVILKAIALVESGWRQFDRNGNVVTNNSGPRPGLGIMQVTSYNSSDRELVNKLKYDIDFNISSGADILNSKWEMVPQIGDGDRNKLENWYFALWAYNSWGTVNNPNNASAGGRLAYQDLIIKKASTEYYPGVVTPVNITPISAKLLSPGTLPKWNQTWKTPEPFTLGDLKIGSGNDPNRGSSVGTVARIAGQDRIDTVNRIALYGWPNGAGTVIITRADDFPDALAGVPLAKKHNAPILVTDTNELDNRVIDVLKKLKPQKVIILGGNGAVGPAVESKIREVLSWTNDIRRIAGENRFETAAIIAQEFSKEVVAIATASDFPDALSLASAAASMEIPLLLTSSNELSTETLNMLQKLLPKGVYIAGGEKAISDNIVEMIAKTTGNPVNRIVGISGKNRYETSVRIAESFFPQTKEIYMATGQAFTDPLAAGALAAAHNACLLLVSPQGFEINSPTENYLRKLPASTNVKIIGGEGIISENTVLQIKYLLRHI